MIRGVWALTFWSPIREVPAAKRHCHALLISLSLSFGHQPGISFSFSN